MPSGRFSKQAVYFTAPKLNGNYNGDSVIGGNLTTAPSGFNANQGQQTLPGDRIILSPSDANYWSNNTVGILYTGTYRYVASNNGATSVPQRGRACFWECNNATGAANNVQDGLYQITSDEDANHSTSLFAGVFINNFGSGNYWWIQESGKASCWFKGNNGTILYGAGNITGTAAIGAGVYLAAVGNNSNNNTGLFDQLNATSANYAAANMTGVVVDYMLTHLVGVAEGLPSNGNISLVDLFLNRASFRW